MKVAVPSLEGRGLRGLREQVACGLPAGPAENKSFLRVGERGESECPGASQKLKTQKRRTCQLLANSSVEHMTWH